MYYRTALPTMPSESRQGFPASPPNEFVDHRQADELIRYWKAHKWQEQVFFGEDFAGRDDVSKLLEMHRPQVRETIGAFYRPLPQAPKNDAPMDHHRSAISENLTSPARQESSMMYRYAAVAAFVCILGALSAFLTHGKIERNNEAKRPDSQSKTIATPQTAVVAPSILPDATMLAKETNLPNQP
jgi:hypothetical protein